MTVADEERELEREKPVGGIPLGWLFRVIRKITKLILRRN